MSNLGRFIAGGRVVCEARKERVLIELRLPGHDPRAAALWCIAAAVGVARWRRVEMKARVCISIVAFLSVFLNV